MKDTILCLGGAAVSVLALVVGNLFPTLWWAALVIVAIGLAMAFVGIRMHNTIYIKGKLTNEGWR